MEFLPITNESKSKSNPKCNKNQQQAKKYPRSIGFIISNEFCERFNYYGMRTILVLYLTSKLHYTTDEATVLFHVFTMLVYFFPLAGALIADSWLGKYKTILYLSIVYAIGGVVISIGAIPTLHLPVKGATILGLLLIALGTGGIKPCVSAFGGDQFKLPEQTKQLATFFSLFYFAINAGSMISTSITPIMREDVHCFGETDCFSLAFGVPAFLMLVSVLIFIAGKNLYVVKKPAGNMIFRVSQCINEAFKGWRKNRGDTTVEHWLDHAEPKCGKKLVSDTKVLFKILVLYLPFPVFWALFDQQGSRWTFQATRMSGALFGYNIKPDQMQVINPLLILGFIPLFDYVLYPLLSKIGIKRPLQKLTVGGLLAATAFILSAFVELKIEANEYKMPAQNEAYMRLYNGLNCTYEFNIINENQRLQVEGLSVWEQKYANLLQNDLRPYKAESSNVLCGNIEGTFELMPGKINSYTITNGQVLKVEDILPRPGLDDAQLRIFVSTSDGSDEVSVINSANVVTKFMNSNSSQLISLPKGVTTLQVNGKTIESLTVQSGGVYAVFLIGNSLNGYKGKTHTIVDPNTVHMLWQLPQIIVITAAEIMFSVTGLEFSFTQAPESMKSVLQACWLLSVAVGNMLVVVIAELKFFDSQAAEFLLFAGLMIADMFIFMLLAIRYKYVDQSGSNDVENSMSSPDKPKEQFMLTKPQSSDGHANAGYLSE